MSPAASLRFTNDQLSPGRIRELFTPQACQLLSVVTTSLLFISKLRLPELMRSRFPPLWRKSTSDCAKSDAPTCLIAAHQSHLSTHCSAGGCLSPRNQARRHIRGHSAPEKFWVDVETKLLSKIQHLANNQVLSDIKYIIVLYFTDRALLQTAG